MKIKIFWKLLLIIGVFAIGGIFVIKNRPAIDCENLLITERPNCWVNLIEKNLKSKGLSSTLAIVKEIYDKDEEFAQDCHSYMHLIGEEGYKIYKVNGALSVTKEASYCGYGFYHGFTIALMQGGGDLKEAAGFCEKANKEVSANSQVTGLDCFHGIGHGVTDYSSDQLKQKGDEQKLIDASLDLCKRVATNKDQLYRCSDGVFHSIGDIYLNGNFSFLLDKTDPLKLCRNQNKDYQKVCYGAMAYLVMQVSDGNFTKALSFVKNLPEEYAEAIIRTIAGYEGFRSVEEKNHDGSILSCRSLDPTLGEACLKGLIEGLTDFGVPDKEEETIINFCSSKIMFTVEKDICFYHATDYFLRYFGQEKKQKLCDLIEAKYCQ